MSNIVDFDTYYKRKLASKRKAEVISIDYPALHFQQIPQLKTTMEDLFKEIEIDLLAKYREENEKP